LTLTGIDKLATNGTAVSFVGVIPTQGSASSRVLPGRNLSKATARRVWRGFCRPGTEFCELLECRGTSSIGAGKLSRCRSLIAGTGAVAVHVITKLS